MRLGWVLGAVGLLLAGCEDERITSVSPEIVVERNDLSFGPTRVSTPRELRLGVIADSRTSLSLSRVEIEDDPAAPGGAAAFAVSSAPEAVDGETRAEVGVTFTPGALGDFRALLAIDSDDPDEPDAHLRIPLTGRGALPRIRTVPDCTAPCAGFTVTASPPEIDFGLRPALRTDPGGRIINEPVWPSVTLLNEGEIPLTLKSIRFTGDFGFATKQSINAEGVSIEPGGRQTLTVMFDPKTTTADNRYAGELLIASDDPDRPEAGVLLKGELAPNKPPVACASIVAVLQPTGIVDYPLDGTGQPAWRGAVAVQPGQQGLVYLSAFSDHFEPGLHPQEAALGDLSKCSSDPEDGRQVLTYRWRLLQRPAGSAAEILAANTPEPALRAHAAGAYQVELEVADPEGAKSVSNVEFQAVPQRDLAVELSWEGQPEIDLDLHLVKPGPCGSKADCLFDLAGDVNGFSAARTGGVFDWGEAGKSHDDPRLEMDDQGDRSLIESITLNRPENDPACATQGCTYDVYVHYFKDWRTTTVAAPTCPGRPCSESQACGCETTAAGAGAVCVSGRCVQPVRPTVKVYVRATPEQPDPVMTIPAAGELVSVAGPCFLWHVARIAWPSQPAVAADPAAAVAVTPVATPASPELLYFGSLEAKSFSCSPNSPEGTPAGEVTYVPGSVPVYP